MKLSYFGLVDADTIRSLGIEHQRVTRRERREPAASVYAVSATVLQGAYGAAVFGDADNEDFAWLKKLEPEAVIGYTIFIYRVTDEDVARLKEPER